MLRSIIICPDADLGRRLEQALLEGGRVGVARRVAEYPNDADLDRMIRANAPDVVFLGIQDMRRVSATLRLLEKIVSDLPVVAVGRVADSQALVEVMRAGIREFVAPPFESGPIIETLVRVNEQLQRNPPEIDSTEHVYSFLPSKAGTGTSTIALNLAGSIARRPDQHVLLADFDLNSGMTRFLLKLQNTNSIAQAATHAFEMDEVVWPKLVTSMSRLDVLHAGRINPNFRLESAHIRHLTDFWRRIYKVICFDLSGALERYSMELMEQSKRIFLVCTPEIPSLHLAREKLAYLRTQNLDAKVSVIVNRCQKRMVITPENIEQLLGVKLFMSFPNDYAVVHRAAQSASLIEPNTELGQKFLQLSHLLLEDKAPTAGEPSSRKRFIEFFSIVPKGYQFPESKKPGA